MTPEAIVRILKNDILAGRIPAGSELRQTSLAARFGVSRIPVRDVLRALAADGFAAIEPGRIAVVVRLTADEVAEIFDLRLMLECDCLLRAADLIDDVACREVERACRKAELDAATPEWSDGDWAFHATIYSFANRPRQVELVRSLRQTCRVAAAGYEALPDARSQWLSDHTQITERLRAGDGQGAVEALRRHLEGARDHLLARLAQPGSPIAG